MTVAVHERPSPRRPPPRSRRTREVTPPVEPQHPHVDKALAYCREVLDGTIPACRYVRLACQRFLDNLESAETAAYPYRFDRDLAERACEFAECLPHIKGKWALAGELIVLQPHQCFRRCNIFGWVRKVPVRIRMANGTELLIYPRRFRRAYTEQPRKTAKSTDAAIDGLYCFAADNEFGAECYSGATTEKQAWEVFGPARLMADRTPEFREEFGVEVGAKALTILRNGSRFLPLIGKPGDGASPSFADADEYHEHETDDFADTMLTGMGARVQPLMEYSTTAGDNIEGPCYAVREEVIQMLEGVVPNEELWGIIYTIDEGVDWTTEAAIIMATPNLDVSVDREFLLARQKEAIAHPRKAGVFKTKHLNLWVAELFGFHNMEDWRRCANPSLRLEDCVGWECILGLDMAQKIDFASAAYAFRLGNRYRLICKHWLPEETALDPAKQHYLAWVEDGHVTATEGGEIDFERVESELVEGVKLTRAGRMAYDATYAVEVTQRVAAATGIERVDIPMGRAQTFSPPMLEIEAALKTGRFEHDGNPATTWHFANVVAKEDARGNYYPRKRHKAKKIDGAVASYLAVGQLMNVLEAGEDKDSAEIHLL